jgi:hypothetical protein
VLGRFAAAIVLSLFCGSSFRPAAVQAQSPVGQANLPEVRPATRRDTSKLLTKLPQLPPRAVGAVLGRKLLPYRIGSEGAIGDGALQTGAGASTEPSAPSVLANFEGVNNVNGVLPPDPTGDIGPNHYVQMVNLSFAIWDRAGNKLYGPADTSTLWQGFGGPCETSNDGDPIVQYDHLADRWMMSQFALPNFPKGPFYECIAISQTADPLGAWHRYEFTISETKLDDYPKFGVWPDGYYMSVNQFSCHIFSCSWAGQGVVAFERDQMLNGLPAQMVYFDLHGIDPNLGGMLPADLDGTTLPPAGAPNAFVQVDDNAWGYSPDQLQVWNFHVDWSNTANSTFTSVTALPTAAFDSNMCAYSRNCIPQRDTAVKVDAIADRLMYRLQYRNFGTHQTLVTNHTVDVNGTDRAGVRWYELRNSGGGWSIFQQGTFSPDSHHRWMGSVAMNGLGDIALGYSVSSSTLFPSIAATGRLNSDGPGAMTQGELAIVVGSGHQTHSAGRWGDYSQMAVDPIDDCTFWYTQEYFAVKGSAPWQTRIGSFKLRDCGPVDNPPTASIANPTEGATVAGTVQVAIAASDAEDAAGSLTVEWNIDGGAWQPALYDAGLDRYVALWDTAGVGDGTHRVNARAIDSGSNIASDSNAVTVDNVAEPPTTHLGDLDRSSTSQGSSWTAIVTLTVHDQSHNAVAGATVSGTWSNGASGPASCVTNSAGQCTLSKGSILKRMGSVTFTVNNVTHASVTYASAGNHDPDGDSNGTTITVPKP